VKLGFLSLSEAERRVFIEEAATRKNVLPILLEKDFWVCWLLGILFESEFAPHFVFKGGTSLSKVFGVIDRFSEDIDLSLSPAFLSLPEPGASRSKGREWIDLAEATCGNVVQRKVQTVLEAAIVSVLGTRPGGWLAFETDERTKSPVLLFHYPTSQPGGFPYLQRAVKIEFGSLTDQQPTGRHPIHPWIAEVLPDSFRDWRCEVVALEVERTFWEKATILHVEYHREEEKATPSRFSRHYADTAALAAHSDASKAIDDHALRERVVQWKSHFFGTGWARYEEAKPGSFRLVPPAFRVPSLRQDYAAMRDMYLSEPPSFDNILATLTDLERRINQSGN
jgi:hypothetical protein